MILKSFLFLIVIELVYSSTDIPDSTVVDKGSETSTTYYEFTPTTEYYNETEIELRAAEAKKAAGIDLNALSAIAYGSTKAYYLRYRRATYWQAVQFCIDEGKRLASIDNINQSDQLLLLLRYSSDGFYMAGTDLGREGSWIWINRNIRIQQPNWALGQPDNAGGVEHCLQVNQAGSATWNDVDCNMINFYICEDNPQT